MPRPYLWLVPPLLLLLLLPLPPPLVRCLHTAPAAGRSAKDAAMTIVPAAKKKLRWPWPSRWSEITPTTG